MKNFWRISVMVLAIMFLTVSCSKDGRTQREGERFLKKNAKEEGVITTSSGLQYKILVEGTGGKPSVRSEVVVNYEGKFIDGKVFDSGESFKFYVYSVISGWQEALQLMTVGSTWMVYVPYYLGYGTSDSGSIPAFSALIFKIELLQIK